MISGILKDKGHMESLHIPNTMSIQQVNPYAMSMIQVSNVAFLPHIYYSLVYYKYITRWHCSVPGEGRQGRDRMVVGFTTTCAISTYHHKCCEFEPRSWRGVLNTTLLDKVCQ